MAQEPYYGWPEPSAVKAYTVEARDEAKWKAAGLRDPQDFAEGGECGKSVKCYAQREYADDKCEGLWFCAEVEKNDDGTEFLVVYKGSFGEYNSIGNESYTHALVFNDREAFDNKVASLNAEPEMRDGSCPWQ